jgi:hypothetical protein
MLHDLGASALTGTAAGRCIAAAAFPGSIIEVARDDVPRLNFV